MNHEIYRRYLREYIQEAIDNSNGTNSEISNYLWEKNLGRFTISNKQEKQRALADARKAFDDHRHWPQKIILSHIGIENLETED
jgi:hypothetical protein